MGIMALTGLMLGTISYETMQDYHTSTQSVAGLYTFNDALDEWETVLEDYVVNSTEIARQACLDAWDEVGMRLDMVDMGAVCSCRARLGIRKELGGFLSSADRTDSGLKGLLSALCIV